jgi:hypothetical protein
VPPPVFWRQNQGSIHPVGPVFSCYDFTTKYLSNQHKYWVFSDISAFKNAFNQACK